MSSIKKRVLVAPLNWGLGHATRSIPLINELLRQNAEVYIGADGDSLTKLRQVYPEVQYVKLPGIRTRYHKKLPMSLSMMLQLPSFIIDINKEHQQLKKIITELKLTHIISDNRYGIYSETLPSAFITHQLHIQGGDNFKFVEPLLLKINKTYISKFDELWVPDLPAPNNLSGKLSDTTNFKIKIKTLGHLSRFTGEQNKNANKKYQAIALLSGPEPQRTILEEKILAYFSKSNAPCLLVRGKPELIDNFNTTENITVVDSISDQQLTSVLNPETLLICRSGYSTLMDLVILGHRNIILVPTPGQTEQEYLAERMKKMFNTYVVDQEGSFDFASNDFYCNLPEKIQHNHIKNTISEFLSK